MGNSHKLHATLDWTAKKEATSVKSRALDQMELIKRQT
jgi:hypothetical protein